MKAIKLVFGLVIGSILFTSCVVEENHYHEEPQPSIEDVITSYDIWYVDFDRTTGYGDVPFISKAFTLSFDHGKMYANNNIVGIGVTGDGYGVEIGSYSEHSGLLSLHNNDDGTYRFEVGSTSSHSISLYNATEDVTYYLEGYAIDDFDFDQVFYDNLEYFLQEYDVWAKSYTSEEGEINTFDNENYLSFTPEDITTFYSSIDDINTSVEDVEWDYVGSYAVSDIIGHDTIKDLTLRYDSGDTEAFELSVIDDGTISLYHYDSGTTYEFEGLGFIPYKKGESRSSGRKRFKVTRKAIPRKAHKKTTKKEHIKGAPKAPVRK